MEMLRSVVHDCIDTCKGKGKESTLYTTAFYTDSTRRTAYQLGYPGNRESSSPFVNPD